METFSHASAPRTALSKPTRKLRFNVLSHTIQHDLNEGTEMIRWDSLCCEKLWLFIVWSTIKQESLSRLSELGIAAVSSNYRYHDTCRHKTKAHNLFLRSKRGWLIFRHTELGGIIALLTKCFPLDCFKNKIWAGLFEGFAFLCLQSLGILKSFRDDIWTNYELHWK